MIAGFRAGWAGLRHWLAANWVYVWANVLWAVLTLTGVGAAAAWAGLTAMSYHAHRHPSAEFGRVWEGVKAHFWRTLPVSLIGLLIVAANVSNLIVYRDAGVLRIVWAAALAIWFGLQLYAFPLLHAMERPSLLGAYRNALTMVVLNPLYTLAVWLVAGVVIAFSAIFPIALLLATGGALAAIANSAVQDRLRAVGIGTETPVNEPIADPYWDGVS
jgi:uncharacterized membrane protein YesL